MKNTIKITLITLVLFLFLFNIHVFAGVNPPRNEIENMIEEAAVKRGVPAILLKGIARVESVYQHFNNDGSPKICGTSIGLMQINNIYGGYDNYRLKYDIMYNIEAGIDMLLNKWSMSSYKQVSSVGNMDPDILENWYFALWAYNGWSQSNNPVSFYAKKYTYQQLVYDVIEKEYGKKINNIDFKYLPREEKPSRSLIVPTPEIYSTGNIVLYEKGDYVRTDGIRSEYYLRDVPGGNYKYLLGKGRLGTITEGPVLTNGYYWYNVYVDENESGWIERNWLIRTGDIHFGRYIYDDISYHWARKAVMELYGKGIISPADSFNPDNIVTLEEYCVFLSKALNYIETQNKQNIMKYERMMAYEDIGDIQNWALKHVKNIYEKGLLKDNKYLNPTEMLTRKEAVIIINKLLTDERIYVPVDIEQIFSDLSNLSKEEVSAVKTAYLNGIVSGKFMKLFCPEECLTRAEAAVIMQNIVNKYVR